jgi:hypothetical protein
MMSTAKDGRGWKLVALLSLGLWIGYLVAQFTPGAMAQPTSGVLRVQLDTSNCVSTVGQWTGADDLYWPLELEGLVLPGHTGEGGPVPPTGRAFEVDLVWVMHFEGDRVRHLTMVMHDLVVDKQLGWA